MRTNKKTTRNGAASVEFALVAPLLLVLVFGMFEASRFLMGLHAATGAAREAVRIMAVAGEQSTAESVAVDYLRRSSFDVGEVNFDFVTSESSIPGYQNIECTVEVDYADVSLIGDPFNIGASHVRGYSAMLAVEAESESESESESD